MLPADRCACSYVRECTTQKNIRSVTVTVIVGLYVNPIALNRTCQNNWLSLSDNNPRHHETLVRVRKPLHLNSPTARMSEKLQI